MKDGAVRQGKVGHGDVETALFHLGRSHRGHVQLVVRPLIPILTVRLLP